MRFNRKKASFLNKVFLVKHIGFDDIHKYYDTVEIIGLGTFGTVYKMVSVNDKETWAVKKTDKNQSKPRWETQILSSLKHINIIFVKELIETDNFYFMVMEYCSWGSLASYCRDHGRMSEIEIKHVMRQFGEAIKYLHNLNIAHLDLKTENLLLKDNVNAKHPNEETNKLHHLLVKLIDFGLSVKLKKTDQTMVEYVGTPLYMAPEIVNGRSYSKQCDIWSMGIVMLILLLDRFPFSITDNLRNEILAFDIVHNPLPNGLEAFSCHCIEALKGLLNPDPLHRRSACEFLNCLWITGNEERWHMNVLELMKKASNLKIAKEDELKVPMCPKKKSTSISLEHQ